MNEVRQKPVWPLWLASPLVLVLGIGIFILFIFHSLSPFGDQAMRFTVPGESKVVLDHAGGYCIYQETSRHWNDKEGWLWEIPAPFTCELTAPDGSVVRLKDIAGSMDVGNGEHREDAIYSFDAPVAGSYKLKGLADGKAVLVFGPGVFASILELIIGFVIAFGTAGLVVIFPVLALRRMARNRSSGNVNCPHCGTQNTAGRVSIWLLVIRPIVSLRIVSGIIMGRQPTLCNNCQKLFNAPANVG